jgi:hypothetical protein
VQELQGRAARPPAPSPHALTRAQREHSANIKAPPAAYPQTDPPKTVNILEFDCRGLEFTEFKPEVRHAPHAARPHANPAVGRVPRRGSRVHHQVGRRRPPRRRVVRLRREDGRGSEHHEHQVGDTTGLDSAPSKIASAITIYGNIPAQPSEEHILGDG